MQRPNPVKGESCEGNRVIHTYRLDPKRVLLFGSAHANANLVTFTSTKE